MKKGIRFLKVDLIFQMILGSIYIFTGILGFIVYDYMIIALLVQLLIGAWQMMSALVFVILNKEKQRITYLLSVICYLVLIGYIISLGDGNPIEGGMFFFVIGLVIIPIAFGIWYYLITLKDYQQISKNPPLDRTFISDMEGVLDSDELL